MTGRERIRALLAGRAIDRVANGLGGCETAGMHLLAYENLKKVLGLDDPGCRMYTFMTNAVFEPAVLKAIGGDLIVLNSRMCPSRLWGPGAVEQWKDQRLWGRTFQVPVAWNFADEADGSTRWLNYGMRCPPGGIYFDWEPAATGAPLPDMADQPSPDDFHPAHELPEEMLREMETAARWLHENTDLAICCGESVHDLQLSPGGTLAWWMRLASERQACHDFLAKAVEASLAQIRQVHQAVGGYCEMMAVAHDLGDRRGVTMGPDLWREIYLPHYRDWFAGWHARTDMKIMLHACGSMCDILGDLIECGLDIFNPVQVSARGMSAPELAARFGEKLIFYGGALDAVVTPPGTPDEAVYEQAAGVIRAFAGGRGYLFAGTHNIPGDTPPGHLKAILRAFDDAARGGAV